MNILQQLEEHGYKEWTTFDKEIYKVDHWFQKKVYNEFDDVLYFINVKLIDFSKYLNVPDHLLTDLQATMEVQFYHEGGEFFDVSHSTQSLVQAENFFHHMYFKMDCIPYEERA